MMKKIIALFCIISLVSLVGCAVQEDTGEEETTGADETTTAEESTGTAGEVSDDIINIEDLDEELDTSELDNIEQELAELEDLEI